MVIYLRWKKDLIIKIVIVFLVIVLICMSGYLVSFLRYNDKNFVDAEALMLQNKMLQDKLAEIESLKENNGNYVIGQVILRNMHDFYNEVVIDLGSKDGVKVGNAVVNSEGLVGVIYKVDDKKSYVKLLSSNYNVAVKINDTYGNLNMGVVTLLNKYVGISIGDKIYTSNYGGVQADIYVGEVTEIMMDKDGLGQEARIKLIDNNNLNYVSVMVNES